VAITIGPLDDFFLEDSCNHSDYNAATKQLIECNGLLSLMCACTPSKLSGFPVWELDCKSTILWWVWFGYGSGDRFIYGSLGGSLMEEEISMINSAYLGIVITQKRRRNRKIWRTSNTERHAPYFLVWWIIAIESLCIAHLACQDIIVESSKQYLIDNCTRNCLVLVSCALLLA